MRITGGQLRSRQLESPSDDRLRPTQDRVRQALFNIIGVGIEHASFLDLFAGTGAVGIEAWSRGAERVTFVESGRQVMPFLLKNVQELCPSGTFIWRGPAEQFIKVAGEGASFDFIYADPPYGSRDWSQKEDGRLAVVYQTLDAIYSSPLLKPGGMVVWECRTDMKLDAGEKWDLLKKKEYGGTTLLFLSPRHQE
jgi:16S rRNA (guanine966-N2)-methyltransferase